MISPQEALARLKDGNQRFAAGTSEYTQMDSLRRQQLVAGQKPFAIILGCSDSRVPAEIIFDQGLGDLFVIRVAGNIVAPSLIGSIEFAAEQFGTRLVIVLGHSQCGAVEATLAELERPSESRSPNLGEIVTRIQPAVEGLLEHVIEPEQRLEKAIRANVAQSIGHLKKGSEIIEGLLANDQLMIVGAEYSLESGQVDFFM